MARRGFFAEMQYQAKKAAKEEERRQRAAVKEHNKAVREAERALKAEARAQAAAERADQAERKRLAKEAKLAHVEAMEAEAAKRNARLLEAYDDIDGLLAATLDVDDFVDLETMKRGVEHPLFCAPGLESPLPRMPELVEPPKVKGLFGRKRREQEAMLQAKKALRADLSVWQEAVAKIVGAPEARPKSQDVAESMQRIALEKARAQYDKECARRVTEVDSHNARVEKLIADLGYGAPDAVHEYLGIVLSNSIYPDSYPVEHEFEFEPSTAELRLRVFVPDPSDVPGTKAYKYKKASDEITSTALTQKARKDRYASAVNQVALRSLHEVFEADRRGLIRSIALEVGAQAVDPATGLTGVVTFVAAATDRETFMAFNLEAVVPEATLKHLGAAVSKDPFGLVAVDPSGVRKA